MPSVGVFRGHMGQGHTVENMDVTREYLGQDAGTPNMNIVPCMDNTLDQN